MLFLEDMQDLPRWKTVASPQKYARVLRLALLPAHALDACYWALQEVGASISSALANAKVEAEQACYLPVSRDSMPVIGKVPGVQGCYMASGKPSTGASNAITPQGLHPHQALVSEAR